MKQMKLASLILLLALVTVLLCGCGSDKAPTSMVGTWKAQNTLDAAKKIMSNTTEAGYTLTFWADGTVDEYFYGIVDGKTEDEKSHYSYTYAAGVLTFGDHTCEVRGNSFTLKAPNAFGDTDLVFKKK